MTPRLLRLAPFVFLFVLTVSAAARSAGAAVDLPNPDGYWATPAPPDQRDHAAVYFSRRDLLIAVVPVATPVPSTEVWALPLADGDAWIRLATGGPVFGAGLAAVYDPYLDRILVQGGLQSDGRTWVLRIDPEVQWSELQVEGTGGPGARWEHTAVYNSRRRSVILFGGNSDQGPLRNGWELRFTGPIAHWIPLHAVGQAPGPRVGHAAVYDPDQDRMIIIGGALTNTEANAWELSFRGQPWRPLSAPGGPNARLAQHTAVLDAQSGSVLVYGGAELGGPISEDASAAGSNDVWKLSIRDPVSWTLVANSGRTPPPRTRHIALFDPARGRMIVAGGLLAPGIGNETWALQTQGQSRWVALAPFPGNPFPGYTDLIAVQGTMDVRRGRLFVINSRSGTQGETWVLKFGPDPYWERWPDAPVRNTDVAYDSLHDRLLIHGGFNTTRRNLTWEEPVAAYSYWNQLPTVGNPSPRMDHLVVYDSRRDRLAVFGGTAVPPPQANCAISIDTYLLGLSATPSLWSGVASFSTPGGGLFPKGIYDQRGDRLIVMDGIIGCRSPSGGGFDTGTTALDLSSPTSWKLIATHPGAFSDATYDRGRSRMVAVRPRYPGIAEMWALSLESESETWRELDARGIRPAIANETVLAYDPTRDRYVVQSGAGPLAFLLPSRGLPLGTARSEPLPVDGKTGSLTTRPPRGLELEITANPSSRVQVSLSAPGREPATIELYDVRGRVLKVLSIPNGASRATLTADRELRAGLYLVRLQQGDQSVVRKAIIGP